MANKPDTPNKATWSSILGQDKGSGWSYLVGDMLGQANVNTWADAPKSASSGVWGWGASAAKPAAAAAAATQRTDWEGNVIRNEWGRDIVTRDGKNYEVEATGYVLLDSTGQRVAEHAAATGNIWGTVENTASSIWGSAESTAGSIWGAAEKTAGNIWGAAESTAGNIWGTAEKAASTAGSIWGAVENTASTISPGNFWGGNNDNNGGGGFNSGW